VQDRIALVTGAGSGLGAAIADRFARDGALVVVNDVDPDAAGSVASAVGGEAAPFDVTDRAAVDAAVDGVVERHGRIDVLVNNAGIAPTRTDLNERAMAVQLARMGGGEVPALRALSTLSDEAWDRMIQVHLYGTFYCSRAAMRHMEEARAGAIVNMASVLGRTGSSVAIDYAAAKAAIISFTQSLAAEAGPIGIRVNAVAPGFIDTPLLSWMDELVRGVVAGRSHLGRFGEAAEVANVVRFLAGDEASYCSGEVFPVTGGFS
jgi:3-oxoacyl-[acyl-carrier protein] reductase